ncbi:type II and III secretion system protein family protein [Desulfocurvus sp. DL9XJH121]
MQTPAENYAPRAAVVLTSLLALLLAVLLVLAASGRVHAAESAFTPSSIRLTVGKSMVLDSSEAIRRISVADPETADILLISPHQVYLTGKRPGATNLTLWGDGERVSRIYDVNVSPDVARLKEMLHRVLPGEKNIKVMAAGEAITLSGTVTSTTSLGTAVDLAELYAPDKVANLLSVGGVHQVMLEVKVAEMNRFVVEHLGIDLAYSSGESFVFSLLNDLFSLDSENGVLGVAGSSIKISPARNGLFSMGSGQTTLTGFLDVLKQNGLAKVLAEPTLVCRSGEEAKFLAGGEIPVPEPQALGTVSVRYKPYGVALAFTPMVLSEERISLQVFPEVSELDYTNAIDLDGFSVPAITSRRTSTTVELGDGQSFAIAGLLQNQVREDVKKYPVLGDIPILGTLFRSSEYQKNESELVIIVTPHLAKPMEMAQGSLPTDHFKEPNELDFFLFGKMEGDADESTPPPSIRPAAARQGQSPATGMDGEFGHILEQQP